MKKPTTAFLLCLLIVCSLVFASCGSDSTVSVDNPWEDLIRPPIYESSEESREESAPADESIDEESREESGEEPDVPPVEYADAREEYVSHASYMENLDSMIQSIEIISENTLGVLEYTDRLTRTAKYVGLQTSSPLVCVADVTLCGTEELTLTEYLTSDGVKGTLDGEMHFATSETAEDFLARQVSASVLDSELYGSIVFADESRSVILLREATAPESWLVSQYTELMDAYAEVTLSEDGGFEEIVYIATYKQGALTVQAECNVVFGNASPDTVELTPPAADYRNVDSIDPYYSMLYAGIVMERTCYGSGNYHMQVVSQAIGCALSEQISMYHTVFEGKDLSLIHDRINYTNGYSNQAFEHVLRYADGKTTLSENGGKEEVMSEENRCATFIRDIFSDIITYSFADVSLMDAYDMGDFWYIEFEIDPSLAGEYEDIAMGYFLEDPTVIDKMAEEYRLKTFVGHFAVDKDTHMPVSASMEHTGQHVIEKTTYELSYTVQMDFLFGDPNAYASITDTPLTEEAPEVPATPVFYEVTAPNGNKMYLLGTIHIGDNRTAYLPQEIYDALAASDALAVEINVNTLEERMEKDPQLAKWYMEGLTYNDGTTLADHLDEEWYAYAKRLSKLLGYSHLGDSVRPAVLYGRYDKLLLDTDGSLSALKGVDQRLLQIAKESGKTVYDVEDLQERLTINARYSEKVQEWLLKNVSDFVRKDYVEECMEMYDLWCQGDEAALREYLREEIPEGISEEELQIIESYNDVMVVERDGKMVKKAMEYLESGETVFMAVGLAHVLGETGLVDALREAGYTVTLVSYS